MKKIFLSLLCLLFLTVEINAQLNETVNKPLENFEAFRQLFHDNYAFFEEKNINWDSISRIHRERVTENTNDEALFHTFCEMVKPLEDAHVNLIVQKEDMVFSAEKKSELIARLQPIKGKIWESFNEMLEASLKQNGFNDIKSLGRDAGGVPLFQYGDNGKIGYLRVGRCFSSRIFRRGIGLKKQLNTIFKSFAGLEAIVIDIRMNPGGINGFSEAVLGRLTDKKVVGYYKQTKKNSEFDALEPQYIKPKGKAKFLKPVYLLTNDKSVSAADLMALMMSELEHVTIVGENTNGSYSDMYVEKLPNKWMVTLSNQRYLSASKINYEGIGTPVDVEVKNTVENYINKNDKILNTAFELMEMN